MKKWVIGVVGFLLVLTVAISIPVYKAFRIQGYEREMIIHQMSVGTLGDISAVGPDGDVVIAPKNYNALYKALTRSGMNCRIFPVSNLEEMAFYSVTFPDGAVFTVYDGGTVMKGEVPKDRAYIHYAYDGHAFTFIIDGYATYKRIGEITSQEGYVVPNIIPTAQ